MRSEIKQIIDKIEELKRRAEEIEVRIQKVEEEIARLPRGWIEVKWVYNKNKQKYYYYYYRDSSKRSIYLGHSIPPEFRKLLKKKQLKQRLKQFKKEKRIIEERIRTLKNELMNLL